MVRYSRFSILIHCARAAGFLMLAAFGISSSFTTSHGQAPAKGSAQSADSSGATAGQNGKQIFESRRCAGCHGSDAQGLAQSGAPRIAPPPLALSEFGRFVRNPTGSMPPYAPEALSDAELKQIYGYLKSLSPRTAELATPSGNADNGAVIFTRDGCYECHGREGQGARHTGAPRIGPPALAFPEFVNYVHSPKGSMPPYTSKVITDAELADIYAFLKSRSAPPPVSSSSLLNQ